MKFKKVDLNKDFIEQGFISASYDVIIAFNVLHIPQNIEQSIDYARSLLKSEERFVMIETIRVVSFYNALCVCYPNDE